MLQLSRPVVRTASLSLNSWALAATAFSSSVATRPFSSSPHHREDVATLFGPSSTPELDELLQKAKDGVIVPGNMTRPQRKHVFSPKNKLSLENDPVLVAVDGISMPVRHINMFEDLPSKRKLANAIISKAETGADWENVLLYIRLSNMGKTSRQGQTSGISRLPNQLMERFVRRALVSGHPGVVMKALEQAENTNVVLGKGQVLHYVLRGLRSGMADLKPKKGVPALQSLEVINQYIRYYESIYRQMELPVHGITKKGDAAVTSPEDLRIQPWVIAPVMELLAVSMPLRPAEQLKAEQAKYQGYFTRLLSMLKGFRPAPFVQSDGNGISIRTQALDYIYRWEPVYSALRLSQSLREQNLIVYSEDDGKHVESLLSEIKTHLDSVATILLEDGFKPKRVAPPEWVEMMRWSRTGQPVA